MDMLRYLENSSFIKSFEVTDFKRWEKGQYLNLKIEFIDNSVLFVKEYLDSVERNYSFHWQDEKERLLIRWDNAPHYPKHTTFPHHKHIPEQIVESTEISLKEVMRFIEKKIKKFNER